MLIKFQLYKIPSFRKQAESASLESQQLGRIKTSSIGRYLGIVLLCGLGLFNISNASNTESIGSGNHSVLVVDSSGSMKGLPKNSGNADIWDEVKSQIVTYINRLIEGHEVTIYSFDEDSRKLINGNISSLNVREKIANTVLKLDANGKTTCLYRSLNSVISSLNVSQFKRTLVYVFTDFQQACPDENYTAEEIQDQFNAKKSKDALHLYYISLGTKVPSKLDEWSKQDVNVTSVETIPDEEDIFLILGIESKEHEVDFSESRLGELRIDLEGGEEAEGETVLVELSKGGQVSLVKQEVEIRESGILLQFEIPKDKYYEDDLTGAVQLDSKGGALRLPSGPLSVHFVMPKIIEIDYKADGYEVDFSESRLGELRIDLEGGETLNGHSFKVKLIDAKPVKLITRDVVIVDNQVLLGFQVPDGEFYEANAIGFVQLESEEKFISLSIEPMTISFILPKVITIKIRYD